MPSTTWWRSRSGRSGDAGPAPHRRQGVRSGGQGRTDCLARARAPRPLVAGRRRRPRVPAHRSLGCCCRVGGQGHGGRRAPTPRRRRPRPKAGAGPHRRPVRRSGLRSRTASGSGQNVTLQRHAAGSPTSTTSAGPTDSTVANRRPADAPRRRPGAAAMSIDVRIPAVDLAPADAPLPTRANRTHEFASSDASVGREPDRERDRERLAGWSSC